ncbi:hypothetical protein LTR10_011618 [Elasticomyces elasticus]|uniref:RlpA-like protein double-psi beta-barrel domain-containing protein n=1 Tax=Exophiala sideris TaxID=1016849 RepID=A0ABR0JCY8_9EURO|nr:hypothetical protein LTR10_011618 [Elasticomyces elasticus]KAK5061813.1 hypothetical protein LTR69_004996 [Exophiala sideris]KAK5184513.1 hypothetical protein LTR44_003187 [Eurotiomycetes sp. CCFEE 6388]
MAAPAYTHTATEIDWVTVEETVTVWLGSASATSTPVVAAETTTAVATTTTTTPVVVAQATYTAPSSIETTAAAVTSVAVSSYAAAASSSPSPVASSSSSAVAAGASSSAASVKANAITASTTADCEGDSAACVGDVTHWDGGLGACGWNVDTNSTTVQATVGDKCMGCVDRAIDCTDALFNAITDGTGDGRVSGIEWWLN